MSDDDRSSGPYLVTGAAGFIGSNVAQRLLAAGKRVVGVDNLNDYYSVALKQDRLVTLQADKNFTFHQGDIADKAFLAQAFAQPPSVVIHLAAQAGVRHSLEHPEDYVHSNLIGFFNALEACRVARVRHLVYASSSSIYGTSTKVPFSEGDRADEPVSLYAATKRSNELMAHSYAHNHGLAATGLRFFTVYGPKGRPDMAYFGFVDKYFSGEPLRIFNNGDFDNDLYRDFTYIDDIVEGVVRVAERPPTSPVPHQVFNIGNSQPVRLMEFIRTLEAALSNSLGRHVVFEKKFEPLKTGDVPATYADTRQLEKAVGFRPATPLFEGLQRFTDWYVQYFGRA